MKKTFKKALSVVLSLVLTVMCLTGAFVSASAETTTTPEKMLKITPQVAGDAVSFRQQTLTQGHVYKLKMLQNGITGVIPFSTDWSTYTNTPAVAGTEGDYTTYTFTCAYARTRLLFTTEVAGTSGYMADIKLYDTTSGTEVGIDFTTMTFVYADNTYSNWLVDRPDVTAYSTDILNGSINDINFIELLDFDATVFETPEEPVIPEKMLKITPQVAGDAVSFRQQNLVAGHTYKLKMLQKGITGVIPFSTDWSTYTNTPAVAGTEGDYTTYAFTCAYSRTRLLFTTEAAGTSGYMADIKLYDTTSGTEVGIDFTTMTFVYADNTYSNWLVDRPDVTAYSSDILNGSIDDINFVELLDFDATAFETPEEPEEPVAPEKMLKITPQISGDAVSFRQQNLVVGHTYKLKMLQKGINEVIPYTTDFATYTKAPVTVGAEGKYTTYTFDCIYTRNRFLFTTKSAGTSGYIADVKLFDVTSNEYVNISFTTMTFQYNSDTYSNWLTQRPDVAAYSSDILNADIANINFIELLDFDATVFETPENLEKMFRIKNSVANGAVAFNFYPPAAGHTYEISMLQSGVKKVAAMSTNWADFERQDTTVSQRDDYTTYTFTPTYSTRCQIYISGLVADSVAFVSNIRVTDITTNNVVKVVSDDEDWKSAMITGDPQLYQNSAGSNVALMDYDAVALGDIEAEKPADEPEKAIRITAPVYGGGDDNPAAVMTKASVTAGHTYRLVMYKKGILGVQYNEYTSNVWSAHPIYGISDNYGFTVYYFVPTKDYVEIRISIGGSGKTSFISGIKLYDIEDELKVNLINDPTESETFYNWGTHMLASHQMGTDEYSATVCGPVAVMGSTAAITDFNAKCFNNLGDYNGDGIVDVRDFVRLKKFALGQETVDADMFVTDGLVITNEFSYAKKILFGYNYADFASVTSSF